MIFLTAESIELVSVELNLIEHLWKKGRPVARDEPLTVHPLEYAGETSTSHLSHSSTSQTGFTQYPQTWHTAFHDLPKLARY